MIVDGSKFIGQPTLKTQVCIVGSGVAGITLAWYLMDKGIDVTILEGSRVFSPNGPNKPVLDPYGQNNSYKYNENDKLYNGENLGLFAKNEPQFLVRPSPTYNNYNGGWERERIYGGTSTHWGGQSRPLNASTFDNRPGFTGWPIHRQDVDPYYAEACKFLELYGDYYGPDGRAGYNFTAEFWAKELNQEVAHLEGFNVEMYQFVPKKNLQFQARKVNGQTIGESKARVILNASLLNIDNQNDSVTKLTVGVMGGDQNNPTNAGKFTISADAYVLACGAVANARQLLLSNLGGDFVGKYLSAQPIANGGSGLSVNTNLTPKEAQLSSYQDESVIGSKFGIPQLAGLFTPNAEVMGKNHLGSCWFGNGGSGNFYHGLLPKAESRIQLSENLDPVFGQKQSKATWVLSDDEERNYNVLTELFTKAAIANGGQFYSRAEWKNMANKMVYNGHHLCTTRMSKDENEGVVDKNLKIHNIDNLYCAGSSVWTTAGIVNPTFSIVAFSIRLAEHLSNQLTKTDT